MTNEEVNVVVEIMVEFVKFLKKMKQQKMVFERVLAPENIDQFPVEYREQIISLKDEIENLMQELEP